MSTPTLAAPLINSAAALPPEGAQFAPWGGPAALIPPSLFEYLLRLGDTDVVLAQRLGEWVGHGPVLEEDIALTNVGLDLLGQGRMWLSYAGEVEARFRDQGRSEDQLAFLRDGGAYRNLLLAEIPNGDFAVTMARQFCFDQFHLLQLRALTRSSDPRIAEIAAKGVKEVTYHAERSMDWVIRLGDGTDESHERMQRALDALWTYTGEMFAADATELALAEAGIGVDPRTLREPWLAAVGAVVGEATLEMPTSEWMQGSGGRGGKQGVHTEHLGHLLAEMQHLQRAYPGAVVIGAVAEGARAADAPRDRPGLDVVWAALATVPDPEIPVISIVELGIVRDVAWKGRDLVVKVTPTYSGCPATEMINTLIREALAVIGVPDVVLANQLAPPWSTDWIAPEARTRLNGYGIAPPHVIGARVDVTGISPLRRASVVVPCPRCASANTQLLSQFGSTACKAQYRCLDCREPFDYFKPH